MDNNLTIRASGVTHAAGYPRNLGDLARRCAIDGPITAELVRDVDNAHDLDATAIHIEGRHVGWVPRTIAPSIAAGLDTGEPWSAQVLFVAVDIDHPRRPGLAVRLRRGTSCPS